MVAVLILAFGLLGFALQTTNVRFVQSANYRTQATNLANDLIELMRAQRTDTWPEAPIPRPRSRPDR